MTELFLRLRWAWKMRKVPVRHKGARLRLLFHDFFLHGFLDIGGQRCQDCGRAYERWRVRDEFWDEVMHSTEGNGGTLCKECFFARAFAQGYLFHS